MATMSACGAGPDVFGTPAGCPLMTLRRHSGCEILRPLAVRPRITPSRAGARPDHAGAKFRYEEPATAMAAGSNRVRRSANSDSATRPRVAGTPKKRCASMVWRHSATIESHERATVA